MLALLLYATMGIASYYNTGTITASGEKFHKNKLTAAHKSLPFGSRCRVTNLLTKQSVIVTINDRMPYDPRTKGRVIDLTPKAANVIGLKAKQGLAPVYVKRIS